MIDPFRTIVSKPDLRRSSGYYFLNQCTGVDVPDFMEDSFIQRRIFITGLYRGFARKRRHEHLMYLENWPILVRVQTR